MRKNIKRLIRPWYRSRIFWFGLTGVVVIFWSWADSFRFIRSAHTPDRVKRGTSVVSYLSFYSRVGILGVSYESIDYAQRSFASLPSRGFSAHAMPLSNPGWANLRKKNSSIFQNPIAFFEKVDKEIRTKYFYVAHWSLLLVYSFVWAGFYFLRIHCLRRILLGFPISRIQSAEQYVPPKSDRAGG